MNIVQKWVTLLEIASDPTSGLVSGMMLTSEQCQEILSLLKPLLPIALPSDATPDKNGYYVGQTVTIIKQLHGHGFQIGDRVRLTTATNGSYLANDLDDPRIHWGMTADEFQP